MGMGKFKEWLENESFTQAATEMGSAVNAPPQPQQASAFQQEFERFLQFVKKYDYIGIARTYLVAGVGFPKVAYEFCRCMYAKLKGQPCNIERPWMNLLKLIPASILFGTAAYAAPAVLGLEWGALVAGGIKAIQYLYWPFWNWAANNVNSANPNTAKKAQMLLAGIPEEIKQILIKKNMTTEWLTRTCLMDEPLVE